MLPNILILVESTKTVPALECSSESEQAEVVARLLEIGWDELREIEEALKRMDDGSYGTCLATGSPIGIERLRARPWVKYGIEYTRAAEGPRRRKAAG